MRRTGTVLLSFAATIAPTIFGAQASSFVTPGPGAEATPSIVAIGGPPPSPAGRQTPAAPAPDISVAPARAATAPDIQTRSVVVMGAPEVTDEKVAAIPDKRGGPPGAGPLVIRAGIVGGASSSNPAAAMSSASAPATAPQEDKTPLPPNGEQGPKNLREAVEATR
ncbi:hypothetical protein ASD44_01135 [Mesorhizobium sp. Root554]|uniref:hypothetical protein n=1 Tax=unclassified Mesorhizobium TaxID=325217 RepID=UPI0006F46419|nr:MULTISPECIES: hypothetical protein [unclassified Mesorhizobium]KQZ12823.1 hypothetical protein ASD27_01135 [Mesorhizobium sp. Root1471]KQZ35343.1 hypothetical protein ASD44_01135 [Mesorhizobium sp. Root554]